MAIVKFKRNGSIRWNDGPSRHYNEKVVVGQQILARVDKALDRYVLGREQYIAIVPTNVLEIC